VFAASVWFQCGLRCGVLQSASTPPQPFNGNARLIVIQAMLLYSHRRWKSNTHAQQYHTARTLPSPHPFKDHHSGLSPNSTTRGRGTGLWGGQASRHAGKQAGKQGKAREEARHGRGTSASRLLHKLIGKEKCAAELRYRKFSEVNNVQHLQARRHWQPCQVAVPLIHSLVLEGAASGSSRIDEMVFDFSMHAVQELTQLDASRKP